MVGTFSEEVALEVVVVVLDVLSDVLSLVDVAVALAWVVDDVAPDPELPQPASTSIAMAALIEIVFVRAPACMGVSSEPAAEVARATDGFRYEE
jgi:hypothetical protein